VKLASYLVGLPQRCYFKVADILTVKGGTGAIEYFGEEF
jgi:hypothetical protein